MITPPRKRPYSTPAACIMSCSSILATRIIYGILRITGAVELRSPYSFDRHTTYLVLSNHQSRLDPFAIYGSLGLQQNIVCAPTRFLTAKAIYYSPMYLWLKSMGCYPTRNRVRTVPETVHYLASGYNVCVFPEGRRTFRHESNPRDGTALILREVQQQQLYVKVVYAHIEWSHFRLFRKARIRFQNAPPNIVSLSAKQIMDQIYEV